LIGLSYRYINPSARATARMHNLFTSNTNVLEIPDMYVLGIGNTWFLIELNPSAARATPM
jgi:hypothetical protein